MTGTLRALDCPPLQVGGVADHVHILCGLSRKISLAELVKNLKTSSSKILKGKGHDGFSWQMSHKNISEMCYIVKVSRASRLTSPARATRNSRLACRGPGSPNR